MNLNHLYSTAFALVLSMAVTSVAHATFIPPQRVPQARQSSGLQSTMSEAQFVAIAQKISGAYATTVSNLGGKLSIEGDWIDETLNAGSNQESGTWKILITGGLARHPDMTPDGFALIVCHELGHHLGGFPFMPASSATNPFPFPVQAAEGWAANEGMADYFAAHTCAKKIWAADTDINASFRQTVSATAKQQCDHAYSSVADQNICYRTLAGAQALGKTMATLMNQPVPQLESPDTSAVEVTDNSHPMPQCRLDTSFQAALCPMKWDESLVPGKKVSQGIDSLEAEQESAKTNCTASGGYNYGLRPTCWYKPRL